MEEVKKKIYSMNPARLEGDLMMGKRDTSWGTITKEKMEVVQNELLTIKKEDGKNKST